MGRLAAVALVSAAIVIAWILRPRRDPVPATLCPLADRDSNDGIQAWA